MGLSLSQALTVPSSADLSEKQIRHIRFDHNAKEHSARSGCGPKVRVGEGRLKLLGSCNATEKSTCKSSDLGAPQGLFAKTR
jgi:hypothetical protein